MRDPDYLHKYRVLPASRGEGPKRAPEHPLGKKSRIRPDTPKRKRYRALYNSKEWRELRLKVLTERPVCTYCPLLAHEVDHIVPHGGCWELFIDPSNLQSMCRDCHERKSARGR